MSPREQVYAAYYQDEIKAQQGRANLLKYYHFVSQVKPTLAGGFTVEHSDKIYDMDIRKIVGDNVFIIEDAALALLTKDVGKYSDAAFFSFNIAKQMCTFDGCVVTTNRKDLVLTLAKGNEAKK